MKQEEKFETSLPVFPWDVRLRCGLYKMFQNH